MRKLVAILAAFTVAGVANGAPYWVVENQSNQVFRVDVNTRVATLVGPAGVDFVFGGLGFSTNGTLYAWNTNPGNLYTVNQLTGGMTLVGGSGLFGADTFDINPLTNGAIAWSVSGSLNDVNLATGNTTFRVNTSPSNSGIASAFGPDGTYYQLNRDADVLNRVDINTGAVTLIGALGQNLNGTNLGFNPDDGFLYSINIQDPNFSLFRINPFTGQATLLGGVTGLPSGGSQQITAGTFQVAAVPEPISMVVFGSLVVGGIVAVRRRMAKAAA